MFFYLSVYSLLALFSLVFSIWIQGLVWVLVQVQARTYLYWDNERSTLGKETIAMDISIVSFVIWPDGVAWESLPLFPSPGAAKLAQLGNLKSPQVFPVKKQARWTCASLCKFCEINPLLSRPQTRVSRWAKVKASALLWRAQVYPPTPLETLNEFSFLLSACSTQTAQNWPDSFDNLRSCVCKISRGAR